MKYAILFVLVLAVAACAVSDNESPEDLPLVKNEEIPPDEVDDTTEPDASSAPNDLLEDVYGDEVVGPSTGKAWSGFEITGENFKYVWNGEDNPDLVVNEGDLVIITFTSTGGFHDWVVDEFDAATEKVNEGGTTTIEFYATKKGTFEYYCSVGSHRANGMVGNLVVQ